MTKTGAVLLLFCCSFFIFIFFLTFLLNGVAEWDISYVKMVVSMIAFSVTGVKFRFQLKIQKMKKTEIAPFFYSLFFHFLFFSSFFFSPFSFLCPNLLFCYKTSFLYFFFSSLPFSLFYATWVDLYCFLVLLELSLSSSLSFVDRCETASGWWNGRWWTLKWALCSCKLRRALLTIHRCSIQSGRSS